MQYVKIFLLMASLVGMSAGTKKYDENGEEKEQKKETRIRFPHFGLVIYGFKGYEAEGEPGDRNWFGSFGGSSEKKQAYLNDGEIEKEGYTETLIAVKDTLELSEFLFDDRINNTLFGFIPQDKTDRFKLSYAYLGRINEVVDYRNYSQEELEKINYDSLINIQEITPFFPIRDSAKYYFRALPHSPDLVEVKVQDGKLVTKTNSKKQLDWEARQWEKEMKRIKGKYDLRDTLVVIPREYDIAATLTKDKKLFGYDYEAFLFRIERFAHNKLVETKYVVIYIAYGC